MSRQDDTRELSTEERDFVAKLRESYQPEPLRGARATAFHARLEERIEKVRPERRWFPAAALGSAAALGIAVLLAREPSVPRPAVQVAQAPAPAPAATPDQAQAPAPEPEAAAPSARVPARPAAPGEALFEYALLDDDNVDGPGYLPDDYAPLAGLLDDSEDTDAEG